MDKGGVMDTCTHKWEMTNIRYGYLVVEGCTQCGARSSFLSTEAIAPIDEYQEGSTSGHILEAPRRSDSI